MQEMEGQYVEYAMTVRKERVDEAIARLQGRGIEYIWEDAPIETFVTEDGYGFQEADVERVTLRAYEEVAQPLEEAVLQRLCDEVAAWMGELAEGVTAVVPAPVESDPGTQFAPVEVRPGLMIRPSWDEARPAGETTLVIEQAAAFGTGLHPTTQHCLMMIDDLVKPGDVVADLGAGSGILSILARKKGARRVVAVDLNPSTESAIQYHMELNGVDGIEVVIGDVFALFGQEESLFDLVAVNIGGKEAMALAPLLQRIGQPEGTLLLSGIVEWIEQEVRACYERLGYRVVERMQGAEWVTLAVRCRTPKRTGL
jgi:ribosomal protein L11 methyltransferase